MKTETKKPPIISDLTGIEIMHNVLLWCYNWTQEDFKKAFNKSPLGWEYFWDKLQGKTDDGHDPTQAIVGIILNMDNKHQQMLFDYIIAKQEKEILSSREWKKTIEIAEAKALASNSDQIKIELPEDPDQNKLDK